MSSFAGELIPGIVSLLQKPGLIPEGLEDEGQKLLTQLSLIQSVLSDAESKYRNFTYEQWVWFTNLNAAIHNADDLLTELNYEKLCVEVKDDSRAVHEMGTGLLSMCETSGRGKKGLQDEIRRKLKDIVERMDKIVESMKGFSFSVEGPKKEVDGVADIGDSEFVESKRVVVGRKKETDEILSMLYGRVTKPITVISIVGEGGIGRKTLARLVFDRAEASHRFELLLWIVGGNEFNVAKISKCIIDQAIGKDCCLLEADEDLLRRRLRQELSGRRFLLVLDCTATRYGFIDEQLEILKSWLHGVGSFIIVITSEYETSYDHIYRVQALSKEESWELFHNTACIIGKSVPDIEWDDMNGIPLMLNMWGSLVRFKKEPMQLPFRGLEPNLVIHICYDHLASNIQKCLVFCSYFPYGHDMDKDIMIKMWIANGLIDSDGSTNPETKGNLIFNELVARFFFHDVKHVHRDVYGNKHEHHGRVVCKMLDTIRIFLRMSIRPGVHVYNSTLEWLRDARNIYHVWIDDDLPLDIARTVKVCPTARSIFSPTESFGRAVKCDDFPEQNSLRVLHVRSLEGDMTQLKYMKHLRYLDLSGSMIKILPESISMLYSMETLNLSKCLLLCQLPKGMRYMRSLRHLSVDRCPRLKKMPPHLGELSLQTLTTYITGEDAGCSIREIKGLNLGGLLELYNLRKVKDETEATEIDLCAKSGLESLSLCWGGQQYIVPKASNDFHVLEGLKPHDGLKVLKVQQYGAPKCASWLANLTNLKNLVELHLILCTELKVVPPVWQLPSLRVLSLKYMNSLSYIYGQSSMPGESSEGSSELFPALKRLVLIGMKSLKGWKEGEDPENVAHSTMLNFPVLDEIEIINCPKLETMPTAQYLKRLTVRIENPILVRSVVGLIARSSSLVEANITNTSSADIELLLTSELEQNECSLRRLRLNSTNCFFESRKLPHNFLPKRLLVSSLSFWSNFVSLEYLDIFNCNDLVAWPKEELSRLVRLRRLSIRVCKQLTSNSSIEPSNELNLPPLESLEIYGCPLLTEVPKCSSISLIDLELDECPKITSISSDGWLNDLKTLYLSCTSWTTLPNGWEKLTKLDSLGITECYSITSLPNGWEKLTKLDSLRITDCYNITSLPNEMVDLKSLKSLIVNECPRLTLKYPQHPQIEEMISRLDLLKISKCADVDDFSIEGNYYIRQSRKI